MSTAFLPNFRPVFEDDNDVQRVGTCNLYRSSRPDLLNEEEVNKFLDIGLRSIIDLRSASEYRNASGTKLLDAYYVPSKVVLPYKKGYSANEQVTYKEYDSKSDFTAAKGETRRHYNINFFEMNYIKKVFIRAPWYIQLYAVMCLLLDFILWTNYKFFVRVFAQKVLNAAGLDGQYKDMVEFSQAGICSVLKLLCDKRNLPAVVNCAHGKDRTGIVSALVLHILGKNREEILQNYVKSKESLAPMQDRVYKEIVLTFNMDPSFTQCPPEVMSGMLDYIDDRFGSVSNYLKVIGFSEEEQNTLRSNLLAAE